MELEVKHKLSLTHNMEKLKGAIEADIKEKYDVVVTEDSVADTKKVMAQINKDKSEFKSTCKSFIDEISKPIADFKEQQKEIETLYDNARDALKNQVNKFEEHKLIEAQKLISEYVLSICEPLDIDVESVVTNDLVMIGAISQTKSGYSLVKSTKDKIDLRVQAIENEKLKQKQAEMERQLEAKRIADEAVQKEREENSKREAKILTDAQIEKDNAVKQAVAETTATVLKGNSENLKANAFADDKPYSDTHNDYMSKATREVCGEDGKKFFYLNIKVKVTAPDRATNQQIKMGVEGKLGALGFGYANGSLIECEVV